MAAWLEVKRGPPNGPRVKATVVYLVQEQHVPVGRTKQTLKDLLGCEMSAGSVMKAVRDGSERVKPEVERIKEEIREAAVGDFDETGLRVMKGLRWLHVAGTQELTDDEVQAGRGIKAIEAIDILPTSGWVRLAGQCAAPADRAAAQTKCLQKPAGSAAHSSAVGARLPL